MSPSECSRVPREESLDKATKLAAALLLRDLVARFHFNPSGGLNRIDVSPDVRPFRWEMIGNNFASAWSWLEGHDARKAVRS